MNCKKCGRLFESFGKEICLYCYQKDEEDYQKVRLFLKEFPGSKITVVEEKTGVNSKTILRYLREGRIELFEATEDFVCLKCKKPIRSGMYCESCYKSFKSDVKKTFSIQKEEEATAKMHITRYRKIQNKK